MLLSIEVGLLLGPAEPDDHAIVRLKMNYFDRMSYISEMSLWIGFQT